MMISPINIAYIGIGSNLGDKLKNCVRAVHLITDHPNCTVLKLSSFYETEPFTKKGASNSPWYVNCVIKIKTDLNPIKLLIFLLELELELGRIRSDEPWAPRIIDLDLLIYNDEIIKTGPLKVPHPELHKRRFVLEPLSEIEPALVHPVKGLTIKKLLEDLNDNKKVVPIFRCYLAKNASEAIEL